LPAEQRFEAGNLSTEFLEPRGGSQSRKAQQFYPIKLFGQLNLLE
jgi:hypothetical protein